jgi:hypothetical protein
MHWWGCRGVSGGMLAGRWCSHSVASGTLVSEEEGPDNQHEVVGVEGSGGGSVTKGRSRVVFFMGGSSIK